MQSYHQTIGNLVQLKSLTATDLQRNSYQYNFISLDSVEPSLGYPTGTATTQATVPYYFPVLATRTSYLSSRAVTGANNLYIQNGTLYVANNVNIGTNNITVAGASILGGSCNKNYNSSNTIVGGTCNTASGFYATVIGGHNNCNMGPGAVINGGNTNYINLSGYDSTIAGGMSNCVLGCRSVIAGGCYNTLSNCYSVIGGGYCNTIDSACSFIAGGCNNKTCNYGNVFILGSKINALSANFTYVNNLSTNGDIYAGNIYGNIKSTGGTNSNYLVYKYGVGLASIIPVSGSNLASAAGANIGGGNSNVANALYSNIDGGVGNITQTSANFSTIGGGQYNETNGLYAVVGGGLSNNGQGKYSVIGGGSGNLTYSDYSGILGGRNNSVSGTNTFAIGSNILTNLNNFTIVNNLSSQGSIYGVNISGIFYGDASNLIGLTTTVSGSPYRIGNLPSSIMPVSGINTSYGKFSVVNGGSCNNSSGCFSTIGGGCFNNACNSFSVVGGGFNNTSSGLYSYVAAGNSNYTVLPNTFILGSNLSASQSNFTYVNNISSQGSVYANNFIGGTFTGDGSGLTNIFPSIASLIPYKYGSLSGSIIPISGSNIGSGKYSFIAAGTANNINGFDNTFILGSNIIASQGNLTYVNNLSSLGNLYGNLYGNVYGNSVYGNLYGNVSGNSVYGNLYGNVSGNSVYANLINSNTGFLANSAYSSTYNDGIVIDYVTGKGRISVGANDGISIYNNGIGNNSLLSITSGGNIGVGTQTPIKTLTVVGDISATGNIYANVFFAASAFSGNGINSGTGTVKKAVTSIGDNYNSVFNFQHNLGTQDIITQVYSNNGSYVVVMPTIANISTTTVSLSFNIVPNTNSYRVVVMG